MKHVKLLMLASLLSGCGGGGYDSSARSTPAANPPEVSAVAPGNNATGVSANVVVKATFSEAVSGETLTVTCEAPSRIHRGPSLWMARARSPPLRRRVP